MPKRMFGDAKNVELLSLRAEQTDDFALSAVGDRQPKSVEINEIKNTTLAEMALTALQLRNLGGLFRW